MHAVELYRNKIHISLTLKIHFQELSHYNKKVLFKRTINSAHLRKKNERNMEQRKSQTIRQRVICWHNIEIPLKIGGNALRMCRIAIT